MDDTTAPPPWHTCCHEGGQKSSVFLRRGSGFLVLACPHGGDEGGGLDDRISGCFEPDTNTSQLADAVWKGLRSSLDPSLVIGRLHRRKVDLARSRECAADTDHARQRWDDYHSVLQSCLDSAIARHGRAHLVDLHGQAHRPATEVGHLLRNAELLGSVEKLNVARSSLSAMQGLQQWRGIDDAVRGPHSLGSLLEARGYAAVPSLSRPHPCSCSRADPSSQSCCTGFDATRSWDGKSPGGESFGPCSFFWGAHTLKMYAGGGSEPDEQIARYRGKVAAQQLETAWVGCRQCDAQIEAFADALASSIDGFLAHFYVARDA